jgi:hypothetical protein
MFTIGLASKSGECEIAAHDLGQKSRQRIAKFGREKREGKQKPAINNESA